MTTFFCKLKLAKSANYASGAFFRKQIKIMLVMTSCDKSDASTIDKNLVENGGRGGKGAVTTLTCTGQITLYLRMTLEMLGS